MPSTVFDTIGNKEPAMSETFREETAKSYDQVALEYAKRFQHELDDKPFDRKMLELLVERAGENGIICDMGCGPGQIAAYVQKLGAVAGGIDLSPQIVAVAQQLHPHIPFQQGDMLDLKAVENDTYSGIAAFYSIIHIPHTHVVAALRELRRVLRTDGRLLLAFHIGTEVHHANNWFGQPVNLDGYFFETQGMKGYLQTAGFVIEEAIERDPYPQETPTRRAYLFACK